MAVNLRILRGGRRVWSGSYDRSKRMPAKVAIIAALPREIAALVQGTAADAGLLKRGVHLYRLEGDRLEGAVVAAAGMGAERAAIAVEAALATGDVGMLISTGLAGGCVAGAAAGSVMEVHVVVDAKTGERYTSAAQRTDPGRSVTLATTQTIASVREKARLAASYGAMLVDMEAATVARLARAKDLPFRAIKGVSDSFDFELSSLAKFAGKRGSFRTGAFALHTALRPWEWPKAIELGRGSSRALAALDQSLKLTLSER
jgi:adenosylhomocysteine nucleosidase